MEYCYGGTSDFCNKPQAYKITIRCLTCGTEIVVHLCEEHMKDPGPLLAFKCKHVIWKD